MNTFKMAALSPIHVAAMDKLPIDKQEEIKMRFGQPLVLSKAYYLLRDATQNFTSTASDAARKLDEQLHALLVKKGMFSSAAKPPIAADDNRIMVVRSGTGRSGSDVRKRVSFSDYPLAAKFMPKHQKALVQNYEDDDKRQILEGIEENLKQLKGYRSQDGKGGQAMVYAHYFYGQTDYFITETDFDPDAGYENLFGFAILNGDTRFAELGAVGLQELTDSRRIELDFYWTPVTLAQAKANRYPEEWGQENTTNKLEQPDDLVYEGLTQEEIKTWNETSANILGRKRTIHLPNGERHEGQYAIFELDSILASHNEETFADTVGYPLNSAGRNLNDRNYASDKGAQQLVTEYARDLNPDLLLSITSGPDGTPIVTEDGIVVSGNNRTMSMKLARSKYPEKWKAYQAQLQNDFDLFGFAPAIANELAEMSAPVVVRIDYDFGEMTTTNMAKYNASTMKAKSPVDRAAELATTLREQILCETNIPAILGNFDTLGEFYADRTAVKSMVGALRQCSVLNEQDLPGYVDAGYFTEDGKTMLETVLASLILDAVSIRVANRDGVKSMRQVVVNALPVLIQNKNLPPAASLVAYINQAVLYQGELIASGLAWADFVNQPKLFADQQTNYDPRSVYLNRLMASGPRKFRDALRRYNDSQAAAAGATMFANETVTPEDAFKGYIVAAVPADEVKLVERHYVPMAKSLKFSVGETAIFDNNRGERWQGQKVKIQAAQIDKPFNTYRIETEAGEEVDVTEKDLKKTLPDTLISIAKMANKANSNWNEKQNVAAAKKTGEETSKAKFASGDKVVSLKDGTQGVVGRLATSGHGDLLNSYSVKTVDGREVYWYEDEMAPLAAIDPTHMDQKLKRAKTTLALLKKAIPRLEGARLKTAKTEIALLTRFLKKNK